MVNKIYNIPRANNGEQYKDNNNNSIKCLEANNNILLDLAEKYYENLVEVLIDNAIDATAAAYNSTFSLPSS